MTIREMVPVKATKASEQGTFDPDWTAATIAAMGRFND